VLFSTAGQLASEGVRVDYDCDTIIFINSQVLHAGNVGWRCAQTAGHTGPRLCRFTNCYVESCTGSGWLIQAARDVRLSACHAAVNGGNGFEVTGGDSITISDSLSLSNGQHGIVVTGGTGVMLNGNTCSNNSQQASKTYSGIRIENNVTGVRVVNNRSGDFIFPQTNKQKYGISVGSAGTDFLVVTENDLRGNTTGALDDSSTDTSHVITRNIGVAQVGVSSIAVMGSPFTYTNKDGVPEVVYITGGMVSAVVKNSVTILTASPCTVYLDPGEAATVTYSVAPTMNKDRK
jgi:CBS domain-containing protein